MFKGITKRWILNTLSVILTIIILIVVGLIFLVTYIFQNNVEQKLTSTTNELSLVFSGYISDSSTSFTSSARDYVENFDKKEQMEVMVINSTGRIVMSSTGFIPTGDEHLPDFDEAKTNGNGYAFWSGKLSSNEKAMSETRIITNDSGTAVGAVSFNGVRKRAHYAGFGYDYPCRSHNYSACCVIGNYVYSLNCKANQTAVRNFRPNCAGRFFGFRKD